MYSTFSAILEGLSWFDLSFCEKRSRGENEKNDSGSILEKRRHRKRFRNGKEKPNINNILIITEK